MNKKIVYKGLAAAGLWMLAACSNETGLDTGGAGGDAVRFAATLPVEKTVLSRAAFDDEKGETEVLPYINAIHIRKVQASAAPATVTPYNVKTANKGVLEYQGGTAADALKWDKDHLDEPVDFFAWTTPTGVAIGLDDNEGSVDFVAGNAYNANPPEEKDRLNGKGVTPLEVLVSALSLGNDYQVSPSVTLPFTHLASKVSLYLRNWDSQHIKQENASGVSIEFFSIPDVWKAAQTTSGGDKTPFRMTQPASDRNLTLDFTRLYYDANGYFTFYLPPLTVALGTDFASAGDFCITYGGSRFYGTLASIPATKLTELKAGQHMAIQMDLSKNYGVGVGARIVDWKGPDKEDEIFANPNRGIYSPEGLRLVADYLQSAVADLPDSLYVDAGGEKEVRLYNDLTLTPELVQKLNGLVMKGLILNGQGHTITLPAGGGGLFNIAGDKLGVDRTTIKNLNLAVAGGGEVKANGLLANLSSNVTIENCHALAGSIAGSQTNSSIGSGTYGVGGLIGTAGSATVLEYCSSVLTVISSDGSAGGLAGIVDGERNTEMKGCYAQCRVTAGGGGYAGGLVGELTKGSMEYSYFCFGQGAEISGGTGQGILAGSLGLTGHSNQASIRNCFWGIENESTTALQFIGAIEEGETAVTDNFAFLFKAFTQEEGEGNNTHFVTYQAGTLGSFQDHVFHAEFQDEALIMLLNVLRKGTEGDDVNWVWVYGKDYPVIERK